MGVEINIDKHYKMMSEKMKRSYVEWCKDNLKRVVDEWFYGKDYSTDDILNEMDRIILYVSNKFLKWYIESYSLI
jgi:hypothetical protein